MSSPIRDAELEKYEGDKPERVDDGCPAGMSQDHEDFMDKILSDPLLDMAAGLDSGQTPRGEDSRKYIAAYLKKYRLLGMVECGNCGKVNYEGDKHCSQCGTNLMKQVKMKHSLG